MTTDELRQRFLDFFAAKNHKIYPSDSLVPHDDPTLLFTSAGMNQFKQEFIGGATNFRRRATCQKCLRTADLDKVGKTKYHHTFFEMLGNFSFGDYFKDEAISLAWEFVTEELKLPEERLWVSVYRKDEEAYRIWKDKIGIPREKIVKLGAEENFWPSNAPEEGPDGPCGPCSEIFYDQGEDTGCGKDNCSPACDCGRFVEAWNLVFTQFERKGKNQLLPLPNKNIDTGMGLERMAGVLQGVSNNFEIDIFKPVTNEIVRLSRRQGDTLSQEEVSARNAIADHIRAVTFAVADGILPSNDERGYVVRKLIRRAIWHGRSLGIEKPYLYKIVPSVARVMKKAYPQLEKRREDIAQVVLAQEKNFHKTLQRAESFAEEVISGLAEKGKNKLPGDTAFKLYDTYGLPLEMLEHILERRGFTLDRQGFEQELDVQRKISRKGAGFEQSVFVQTFAGKHNLKPTKFTGAKNPAAKTRVSAIFKGEEPVKQAKKGEEIKIVLESTPFYGEAGGQVGDTGVIKNKDLNIEVNNTRKIDQTIVHLGKVTRGTVSVNDRVEARIDEQRRKDIASNHTATHLLQAALRTVLGLHVRQAGSLVGPDRLRFDFTHFQAMTPAQLTRVEELVNRAIQQNAVLQVLTMGFEQAQKMDALAFFGEKYQEKVKVVKIGSISLELCGGTHVASCGDIKRFKIISESSVASGIRRIEAQTGRAAIESSKREDAELKQLAGTFGVSVPQLSSHIENLLLRLKQLDKVLNTSRLKIFKSRIDSVVSSAPQIKGVKVITEEIKNADIQLLRLMSDLLKQKVKACVIVLASVIDGQRVIIICAVSRELSARGLHAGNIIRAIAADVGGAGGGRADFAQAGGKNPAGLKKALSRVEKVVKGALIQ